MADALTWFLDGFSRFRRLPADALVLPSHGFPFIGLHTRLDQLVAHHDARLNDMELAIARRGATGWGWARGSSTTFEDSSWSSPALPAPCPATPSSEPPTRPSSPGAGENGLVLGRTSAGSGERRRQPSLAFRAASKLGCG